jgi:DNA-directed RNA polymerase specialized sigma24 family protein
VLYCVVPDGTDRHLRAALERCLRDHDVRVLVGIRAYDRRAAGERRSPIREARAGRVLERRRIANRGGRRVAERRAMALPVSPLALPRRVRRRAAGVMFVTRAEPPASLVEDVETARLIVRVQEGERLHEELFLRWFDRVFVFARILLKNSGAAEDAAQEALLGALTSLGSFDPANRSFRATLFGLAFDAVERRVDVCPTATGGRLPELRSADGAAVDALSWMSDDDLELLVARLPWPERPALLLRYMVALTDEQAADVLGARPAQVRELHDQALEELAATIGTYGHAPPYSRRESMRRQPRHSEVLLRRRLALLGQ